MSSPPLRPSRRPLPRRWAALAAAGVFGLIGLPALAQTAAPADAPDWASANRRVGELLRGHLDAVRWEAAHPSPLVATPPVATGPVLTRDAALRAARATRPDLVAPPGTGAVERARLQQATAAWAQTVTLAWLDAVAAREALHPLAPAVNATHAATELARRMAAVGNWSAARAAGEAQVWLAVQQQWAAAQQRARATEQRLRQHLPGHGTAEALALPHTLPPLPPPTDADPPAHAEAALAAHPAWPLAEAEAQRREAALPAPARAQLAQALAAVWDAAGPTGLAERPWGMPWPHGWHEAAEARAQADRLARQVRADLALATDAHRSAHAAAQLAEQALALSQQQLDDMQLRYNGMLHSTWDLVAAGRARAQAALALTQARHDAWRAHTDLQAVLAGLPYSGGPANANAGASTAAPKGH
ncbi:TolC family protein [Aquabacterium sp. A08]|uniref:TolC family protein n=1 Tax=Aquabacterium sp. A08 TaxID=2718532 RepID=UPI001423B186|nr:hypothetical protein [Aquabacterium sp. A08]NIC40218.1 hypothetical protein [Aquabacterium sp. A08]